jgi:hypothetical protein
LESSGIKSQFVGLDEPDSGEQAERNTRRGGILQDHRVQGMYAEREEGERRESKRFPEEARKTLL